MSWTGTIVYQRASQLAIKAEELEQNAWNYLNAQSFSLDAVKYYLHVFSDCEVIERPDVNWDDVVGVEETWKRLLEVIHFQIKFPYLFTGKRKPENVLLIGEFGVDKCHLVKAFAKEAGCSQFLYFASTKLFSRKRGKRLVVQRLFQLARQMKPCVLFINDIDRFCLCRLSSAARHEFLSQMLVNNGTFVIGSSSSLMNLDAELRSRFEKIIYYSALEESHQSLFCTMDITEGSPDLTEDGVDELAAEAYRHVSALDHHHHHHHHQFLTPAISRRWPDVLHLLPKDC